MKVFLKSFRKKLSENSFDDIKSMVRKLIWLIWSLKIYFLKLKSILNKLCELLSQFKSTLDYLDKNCDKENGKIALAYNYCYLETVVVRKKSPDQILVLLKFK